VKTNLTVESLDAEMM